VDGGKAFEQPPDSASFIKKGKGKQSQPKPIALEPLNIDADSQVDLAVVEIEEDGQVRQKKKMVLRELSIRVADYHFRYV
jgi:hypothetical protein